MADRRARELIFARRALFVASALSGIAGSARAQPTQPPPAEPDPDAAILDDWGAPTEPQPATQPEAQPQPAPQPGGSATDGGEQLEGIVVKPPLPCPAAIDEDETERVEAQIEATWTSSSTAERVTLLELLYVAKPSEPMLMALARAAMLGDEPTVVLRAHDALTRCGGDTSQLASLIGRAQERVGLLVVAMPAGPWILRVDGVAVTSRALLVDPGEHELIIQSRDGSRRGAERVAIAAGGQQAVTLSEPPLLLSPEPLTPLPQPQVEMPPQVCLSIMPDPRSGTGFVARAAVPTLVTTKTELSPVFVGGGVQGIFHYGLNHRLAWRLGAEGVLMRGRTGTAYRIGGWTGLELETVSDTLTSGLGFEVGYLGVPDVETAQFEPADSVYFAPYVSPVGWLLGDFEAELRSSFVVSRQAAFGGERYALSFVQLGVAGGFGWF